MQSNQQKSQSLNEFKEILSTKYMPVAKEGMVFVARDEARGTEIVKEPSLRSFASFYTPNGFSTADAISLWKKSQRERICEKIIFKPHTEADLAESFLFEGRVVHTHEVDRGFRIFNQLVPVTSSHDGENSSGSCGMRLVRSLNGFDGFDKQSSPGQCGKILSHVFDNICSGNKTAFMKFMGFFAHIIQNPAVRVPIVPVLLGEQGCGKGTVMDYIREAMIADRYYSNVRPKDLSGEFNAALENKLLIFADEATFAGDFNTINELKRLTGDLNIEIERKGIDSYTSQNYARIVIATNRGWAAPIEEGNRRYILFPCQTIHPYGSAEHKAYFQAIIDEKRAGGLAALNHWLKRFDLSSFDPFACEDFFPEATRSVMFTTLLKTDPVEAFLMECEEDRVSPEKNVFKCDFFLKHELPPEVAYSMFKLWFADQKIPTRQGMPNSREFERGMLKRGYEVKSVGSLRGFSRLYCEVGTTSSRLLEKPRDRDWLNSHGFKFGSIASKN